MSLGEALERGEAWRRFGLLLVTGPVQVLGRERVDPTTGRRSFELEPTPPVRRGRISIRD